MLDNFIFSCESWLIRCEFRGPEGEHFKKSHGFSQKHARHSISRTCALAILPWRLRATQPSQGKLNGIQPSKKLNGIHPSCMSDGIQVKKNKQKNNFATAPRMTQITCFRRVARITLSMNPAGSGISTGRCKHKNRYDFLVCFVILLKFCN